MAGPYTKSQPLTLLNAKGFCGWFARSIIQRSKDAYRLHKQIEGVENKKNPPETREDIDLMKNVEHIC